MRRIHFAAVDVVDARPQVVWDVLTDYHRGHPLILPREHFRELRVEEGGRGAGTVISFVFRAGGTTRRMRQIVSEPEPGRVLVESDTVGTGITTFTLTPVDVGRRTRVRIDTEVDGHGGVAGALERLLLPALAWAMEQVYRKELRQLDNVAHASAAAPASAERTE